MLDLLLESCNGFFIFLGFGLEGWLLGGFGGDCFEEWGDGGENVIVTVYR